MKEFLKLKILSVEPDKELECKSICHLWEDCPFMRLGNISSGKTEGNRFSFVKIEVTNLGKESICLEPEYFFAKDKDGFSFKAVDFQCELYSNKLRCFSYRYVLGNLSKVKYLALFQCESVVSVIYNSKRNSFQSNYIYSVSSEFGNAEESLNNQIISLSTDNYNLHVDNSNYKKEICTLKDLLNKKENKIKKLECEIEEIREDYNNLIQSKRETESFKENTKRTVDEFLCKYKFVEDDDYFRIISLEKENTVSFHREFNKSKNNYNWVNKGEALISLKADNSFGYILDGRTIIKSPVSGLFEFNNNKMIEFEEEICRIRKYSPNEKESVLLELETKEIKENVYKKERKKLLEREALDELIEEGKVFNAYTKKDGNRTTIPMDIATAVWNRDGGRCCFCGSRENLEFDHIIPISKGGATTFRNLQILCKNCNIKKSDNI